MTPKEKLQVLQEKILLCSKAYYEEDRPLIPDEAFDDLVRQYRDLEKQVGLVLPNSPTTTIGGRARFRKVIHDIPMWSLDNVYTKEELEKILENFEYAHQRVQVCAARGDLPVSILEMKLDGLSISCTYEKGVLVRALTRGDGKIGEDVTANVKMIASVPKELKDPINITVFGEVVMPKASFQKINTEREALGQEKFANPRNAAAGTLRQKDPKIVKERNLDVYFYFVAETLQQFEKNPFGFFSHLEAVRYLERLGFKTTNIFSPVRTVKEILDQIYYWEVYRASLPYETDGLVIKCDCLAVWRELGYTSKYPKWAFAFKFKSDTVSTTLRGVEWFVGRSGIITPVATFDPIQLGGTTVQRASLHNYSYIKDRDLRIGDVITVKKAAEIIPQVEEVMTNVRTGLEIPVPEPKVCPSCGKRTKHLVTEGQVDQYLCVNPNCPGILRERLRQYVSRDACNIQGLGEQTIQKLVQKRILLDIPDLYKLQPFHLVGNLEHFQRVAAEKLLREIEQSKSCTMERVLTGLGIPGFGKSMIAKVCQVVDSIEEIFTLTEEQLSQIGGIGKELQKSFLTWIQDPSQQKRVKELQHLGVLFRKDTPAKVTNGVLQGKSVLFTGICVSGTREQMEQMAKEHGADIASTVSKANLVIVGKDATSHKKYQQAMKKNIPMMTEEEFLKQIKSV